MRIIEDVRSVFSRDPAARNVFEILTCYSGVQAVIFYRLTHLLWRYKLRWLARFISTFARWITLKEETTDQEQNENAQKKIAKATPTISPDYL